MKTKEKEGEDVGSYASQTKDMDYKVPNIDIEFKHQSIHDVLIDGPLA